MSEGIPVTEQDVTGESGTGRGRTADGPGDADLRRRAAASVQRLTRSVADFPQPGVQFADLTPVFADATGLREVIDALAAAAHGRADLVAGIDARGFLLGSGVALAAGTGVLAVRKQGKLPPPVLSQTYQLEYGKAGLEVPADAIALEGRRVLVVDDVLATGGTVCATVDLLTRAGAEVIGVAVVMELEGLGGRDRLTVPLTSLVAV
ncbi:adenine phosphoribosyltransferase [Rhodococcus sp. D2-41]|nr:adenine phosphoribosyltransferase [Rhodococcus sp. D2-41]